LVGQACFNQLIVAIFFGMGKPPGVRAATARHSMILMGFTASIRPIRRRLPVRHRARRCPRGVHKGQALWRHHADSDHRQCALGQELANLYKGSIEDKMVSHWMPTANTPQGIHFLRLIADGKVTTTPVALNR
jgi:hypothetical protein